MITQSFVETSVHRFLKVTLQISKCRPGYVRGNEGILESAILENGILNFIVLLVLRSKDSRLITIMFNTQITFCSSNIQLTNFHSFQKHSTLFQKPKIQFSLMYSWEPSTSSAAATE